MKLDEVIQKSATWLNRCNELVDSIELKSDDINRVVAALFHLSLEHYGSIHLLVLHKQNGSAFALLRPQLESYIRGLWFMKCATQEQLQSFIDNNNPPNIDTLIKEVEKHPGYEEGVLSNLKENVWGSLCGFTHGGYVQVSWRITPEEITSDFSEDHLVNLVITSCALSLQAYVAIAILVDNAELATSIKEAHQEIFGYEEWHNN